jgi:hypothetical protein
MDRALGTGHGPRRSSGGSTSHTCPSDLDDRYEQSSSQTPLSALAATATTAATSLTDRMVADGVLGITDGSLKIGF